MKQRIEPYERQRIKDLLLSGDEANYKLALQLLSIFFDKREARHFIWFECLACYVPSAFIRYIAFHKDVFKSNDYLKDYNFQKEKFFSCVKKWIHTGDKNFALIISGLNVGNDKGADKLLTFIYCY